jgi:hypothetical protein
VVAHECQAEAGAPRDSTIVGGATAKESFKYPFALVDGNARAGVVHVDGNVATDALHADRHRALGVAVGVVDEVGDHALEPASVDSHDWIANGGTDRHGRFVQLVARGRRTH